MLEATLGAGDADAVAKRQAPDRTTPLLPWIRQVKRADPSFTENRWRTLLAHSGATDETKAALLDETAHDEQDVYARNIESFIGCARVPIGVIGPLRINGVHAKGDYYVPLATTEAALVASYGRGARLLSAAGGASAALLAEAMHRAPGFAFASLTDAGRFVAWVMAEHDRLKAAADATTRHGKLISISPHIEGDHVYLLCSYTTGDAAGQNMVTIATDALCRAILDQCPVQPLFWFVEANFSGDKKASALSFLSVRGRKATASVELDGAMIESHLHTTAARMQDYWRMSALGGVMSGSMGVQGHYANGLAALYIATGQDAACVAESAVGVTRIELRDRDRLYVSVTMPNIVVGAVGGGTALPTQAACLDVLGLKGAGHARALAELVAVLCLAGELSIIGALCAGHFAGAHEKLARGPA
jgi:hydroxymethylglutaryl-CoA reductase (NADPH)